MIDDAIAVRPIDEVPEPPARGWFGVRDLMFFIVGCALLTWLAMKVGWILLVFLVTAPPAVLIFAMIAGSLRFRGAHREGMLRVAGAAARRGAPLGAAVAAYAALCGGGYGRRSMAMARRLIEGESLPDAARAVPGVFPDLATVPIRAGWATGRLDAALAEAVDSHRAHRPIRAAIVGDVSYLLAFGLFMTFNLGFMFYFIVPKYRAIFEDFGVRLPDLTLAMLRGERAVTAWWPLTLIGGLALFGAGLIALTDPIAWGLMAVDSLLAKRHAVGVLRALAMAVEGGRPIAGMFELLAIQHPSRWVRSRMARVRSGMGRGSSWPDSLRQLGFLRRVDAEVLEAAERLGNLPWALREVAAAQESRLLRQGRARSRVVFAAIILGLGAVVGVIAIGFFEPLVVLIRELAL